MLSFDDESIEITYSPKNFGRDMGRQWCPSLTTDIIKYQQIIVIGRLNIFFFNIPLQVCKCLNLIDQIRWWHWIYPPVLEGQINNYPRIGLGKLCKESIILGYSGTTRPDLFYWFLPIKGDTITGKIKKMCPHFKI